MSIERVLLDCFSIILTILTFLYFILNSVFSLKNINSSKQASSNVSDLNEITVIIPVYKEKPEIFEECVKSVKMQNVKFIVVGDGVTEPYLSITKKYGGKFISLKERNGKRIALSEGIKEVSTKYVMFLDSDTILPQNTISRLLRLFKDDVGGVSAKISVINNKKVSFYYAEFYQRLQEIPVRAVNYFGNSIILYGNAVIYRTELIKSFLQSEEFKNPKIFGIRVLIGDDRELTNYIIKRGYRAIVDFSTEVYTYPPSNIFQFSKQVIRWSKTSYYFFLKELLNRDLIRRGKLYVFNSIYTNLILPFTPILMPILEYLFLNKNPVLSFNYIFKIFNIIFNMSILFGHISQIFIIHYHIFIITNFLSSISIFPFIYTMIKNMKRDKLRVLILGSVALGIQYVVTFYTLLTLWKQDKWLTR